MTESQTEATEPVIDPNQSVSRSAFFVAAGGLVSLLAGFASQVLIAAFYGTGAEMDAYLTALTIPLYIEGVLLAGLSFVLIPAFVERVESGEEDEAWAIVGTFFRLVGMVALPLSLLLALFSKPLIALLAPGLTGEKATLAVELLTILAFATLFNGYRAFTVSIENARGRFFVPAAAGALNSIVQIAVMLLLYRTMGIKALAVAFVAATMAQAAVTTVPVLRHGWSHRLPFFSQQMRHLLWLILPFVLLGFVTSLTPILERYFASMLGDGDLSYLGYAYRISMIFQSLLGATIVTAIFPQLSRSLTQDGTSAMLGMFHYGARLTLAVALPIVFVGSVLAVPLVMTLYQRGAFVDASTAGVASVLPIYLINGVLFLMIGNLLTRVFYVVEDTRTVPIISVLSVGIYVLIARPITMRWGYVGLAVVDTIRSGLGIMALVILVCLRYHYFPWRRALAYTARYGIPAVIAGTAAYAINQALGTAWPLIQLTSSGIVAVVVYMGLLFWSDPAIAADVLEMVGLSKLRQAPMGLWRRARVHMSTSQS